MITLFERSPRANRPHPRISKLGAFLLDVLQGIVVVVLGVLLTALVLTF